MRKSHALFIVSALMLSAVFFSAPTSVSAVTTTYTIRAASSTLNIAGLPEEGIPLLTGGWFQVNSGLQINGTFTGTDFTIRSYGSGCFDMTVDGATSTSAGNASSFTDVVVGSGLSDTTHTFQLRRNSANGCYIHFEETFKVTGAAPALGRDPDYEVSYTTFNSPAFFDAEVNFVSSSAGGSAGKLTEKVDTTFRFVANASEIWAYGLNSTDARFVVQQGTTELSPVTGTASPLFKWIQLANGLSGTHTYKISILKGASGGFSMFTDIMTIGGTGIVTTPIGAKRESVYFIGDSITFGVGATDRRDGFVHQYGLDFDKAVTNTGVTASGVTTSYSTRVTELSNLPAGSKPNEVVILWGTNDLSANVATSTLRTAYEALIDGIIDNTPSTTTIRVLGILPRHNSYTPTREQYNAEIEAAVASVGQGRTYYYSTDDWIVGTLGSEDMPDGLHPDESGHAKIENRLAPILADTGFEVSGPSSGAALAASTDFTVSITPGATYTGDQTITISDGGNGGTFTPSVGSASSSSVTVTPADGATSFTFTYTPASSGAKTLTYTNGQNWTNPDADTYTASISDSTAPVISAVASSTTQTTAIITWTTDEAASSTVDYGATASYGSASSSASLVTSHSISLSGLTASTAYHFRVSSTDAAGNRATSSDYVFTTSAVPDTTPPAISAISAGTPGETSATITWTTDEAADSQVNYGTSSTYTASSTLDATMLTSHSVALSGLTANTTYHYRVRSTDSSGNLATSTDQTFTTATESVDEEEEDEVGGSRRSSRRRVIPGFTVGAPAAADDAGCLPGYRFSTLTGRACPAIIIPVPGNTVSVFARDLYYLLVDEDVRALQRFLNQNGYQVSVTGAGSPGAETNFFGPATRSALARFQQAQSITPAVGYFGPITRARVNQLLTMPR